MATHLCFYLLLVLWVLKTGSGLSLVPGRTQDLENMKNLTCFKSTDPEAVRASQLYGDHEDEGDLWSRDPDTLAPLPQCSSSSFSPPASHCEVCLLEEVYMICDNLPAGTRLFLECPGKPFRTTESTCPTLPPTDAPGPDDSHGRHYFLTLGVSIVFVFIIFVIVGIVYKR